MVKKYEHNVKPSAVGKVNFLCNYSTIRQTFSVVNIARNITNN